MKWRTHGVKSTYLVPKRNANDLMLFESGMVDGCWLIGASLEQFGLVVNTIKVETRGRPVAVLGISYYNKQHAFEIGIASIRYPVSNENVRRANLLNGITRCVLFSIFVRLIRA